jgi:hypothetical protein
MEDVGRAKGDGVFRAEGDGREMGRERRTGDIAERY